MQIISESGLDTFSMKKVTERMGVAESLLYKYYPKDADKLLFPLKQTGSLTIPSVTSKEKTLIDDC